MRQDEIIRIYFQTVQQALEAVEATDNTSRQLRRAKMAFQELQDIFLNGKAPNLATFDFLYKTAK